MSDQAYVVGFLLNAASGCVLLLRKTSPAWQHGRLNGVGGKIDPGEAPFDAMHREWHEKTGAAERIDWRPFARLRGAGYDVHFYAAVVRGPYRLDRMANDVGEQFEICPLDSIASRKDVISNLKWLLPLAFEDNGAPYAEVFDFIPPPRHAASPSEAA